MTLLIGPCELMKPVLDPLPMMLRPTFTSPIPVLPKMEPPFAAPMIEPVIVTAPIFPSLLLMTPEPTPAAPSRSRPIFTLAMSPLARMLPSPVFGPPMKEPPTAMGPTLPLAFVAAVMKKKLFFTSPVTVSAPRPPVMSNSRSGVLPGSCVARP